MKYKQLPPPARPPKGGQQAPREYYKYKLVCKLSELNQKIKDQQTRCTH